MQGLAADALMAHVLENAESRLQVCTSLFVARVGLTPLAEGILLLAIRFTGAQQNQPAYCLLRHGILAVRRGGSLVHSNPAW